MRYPALSLTCLLFLTACSGYAPPANVSSLTQDQLVAQMGQPDKVRPIASGTRLEFPRGTTPGLWMLPLTARFSNPSKC